MIARPVIIVRYCNAPYGWLAWFEHIPDLKFEDELPMTAVRRLLQVGTPPGELALHVDHYQAGSVALVRVANWQPPELLFQCSQCGGTGEHAGLVAVEHCQPCRGRGWIAG
jgi:hypothetical protein